MPQFRLGEMYESRICRPRDRRSSICVTHTSDLLGFEPSPTPPADPPRTTGTYTPTPVSTDLERRRYEPAEAEPRVFARWLRVRPVQPRARGHRGRELLDLDPAPERHRGAAHGPCAQRVDPGRPDPLPPHEGPADALDPGHRPRRDRDAAPGREGPRGGGHEPRGAGPRGVRGARLAVAGAVRLDDHRAVQAARLLVRLRARALHARRGLRARGAQGLRGALPQGLHLPRLLHGQLGSRAALGGLRPRGRRARGHRHPLLRRLPTGLRPRLGHGRHGAAGDDAGRHGDRRAPRRRPLHAARGGDRDPADRRPAPRDHRRPVRQARVRHRRAEDHAGP